jgi:K+ transporter
LSGPYVGKSRISVSVFVRIVTVKYLTFILRADNHGEGGVIAALGLTAIAQQPGILAALSRWYGIAFLGQSGLSGFMENPNMANILSLAREKGLEPKPENISFFLGRVRLVVGTGSGPRRWPAKIFAFMVRNATEAAAYYGVPTEQVMEVGLQFEL